MNRFLLVALVMIASAAAGQAQVRTVDAVDVDRYLGDWFELARLPNRFQRACDSDVRATYSRRSDGHIDVVNRCRRDDGRSVEARGVARIVDVRTRAKLKVRFAPAVLSFLPAVWGDYWIIGLAADYSWAVVGSPDRKYLWILGRIPEMELTQFLAAVEVARANGFEIARLVNTEHRARPQADGTGRTTLRRGVSSRAVAERDAAARRLRRQIHDGLRARIPGELVRTRQVLTRVARRPAELFRRQRVAIVGGLEAKWLDSSAGSARLVPVVLPVLHGTTDVR